MPNQGQFDPRVRFQAQGGGGSLAFAADGVSLVLPAQDGRPALLDLHYEGATARPEIVGLTRLPGTANLFRGPAADWQADVATYQDILYRNVYRGVDIHYTGSDGTLKSTYLVAAGSDPRQIRLRYNRAEQLALDPAGNLQITLARQSATAAPPTLSESAPVAWQQIAGRRSYVDVGYTLLADGSVGFAVGAYNPRFQLTIDPALVYGSYFGGPGDDRGYAVDVDDQGNVYLSGTTFSTIIPGPPPTNTVSVGPFLSDVFVTKILSDGSAIAYTTIIGGNGNDDGYGIAVDRASGEVYIAGKTPSPDFPVTNTAIISPGLNSGDNAFIARLNASGGIAYSALLGGNNNDAANSVAIDPSGRAIIAGVTASSEASLPAYYSGKTIDSKKGGNDVFVAAVNSGGALEFYRYLGGSNNDSAHDVAVADDGNIYVGGATNSDNYVTTFGVVQQTWSGSDDGFVTKMRSDGNNPLLYSTYLGGAGNDTVNAIALNDLGQAYVTGQTASTPFYTSGGFQTTLQGTADAFVSKLSTLGDAVVFGSYIGGNGQDVGYDIDVDNVGNIYVVGKTTSSSASFNLLGQFPTSNGGDEAFALKINSSGIIDYGTFLGGSLNDEARAVVVNDADGSLYVTGFTASTNFYTATSTIQPGNAGGTFDAFLSKIGQPAITIAPTSTLEGSGPGTTLISFTVDSSITSTQDITLTFSSVPSSATNADFTPVLSRAMVIAAGTTTGTLTTTIVRDLIDEPDELFSVKVDQIDGAVIASGSEHVTGTIQDDDNPPDLSLTTATQTVSESLSSVLVTATLSISSSFPITASYSISPTSTAQGGGVDYSLTPADILFAPGEITRTFSIDLVNDPFDEEDETIVISLTDVLSANQVAPAIQTITIQDDDDAPDVSFASATRTVSESIGSILVSATLDVTSSKQITVPLAIDAASTVTTTDYSLPITSIVIPAGSSSASISLDVISDTIDEDDETLILSMTNAINADIVAPGQQTITIQDDDSPPTVNFTVATQTGDESAGSLLVTATLDLTSSKNIDISLVFPLPETTAIDGIDFTLSSVSLSFPPDTLTRTLTFTILADTIDEDDETVVISMTNPTNAQIGASGVQTITITDDDPAPTVEFDTATQSVAENAASTTVVVTLTSISARTITVPVVIDSGLSTASAADYSLPLGQLVLAPGTISDTLTLSITDDAFDEFDETVVLSLTGLINADLGATGQHTVTITDDDSPPDVSFSTADQSIAENAGVAAIAATLTITSGKPITVPLTVDPASTASVADYDLADTQIVIPAGSIDASVAITPTDDGFDEDDEILTVTLGVATNANVVAPDTQVITITDDDQPTVSFSSASQALSESVGSALLTATLDMTSTRAISVPFTVGVTGTASGGGVDHDLAAGTITINPGQISGTVSFNITNDTIDEDDETIDVVMGLPLLATKAPPSSQTITILDDDASPDAAFDTVGQTVAEDVGSTTVVVTLTSTSARAITVPVTVDSAAGSATAADYDLPAGDVVIPAGEVSGTLTLNISDDTLDEFTETVVLSLTTATNANIVAPATHVVTITDNDNPPDVQLTLASQTVNENAGAVLVAVSTTLASGKPITVPFTVGGTATAADHDLTAGEIVLAPGDTLGSRTFNLTNDSLDEPAETITVTLATPENAGLGSPDTQTITITDDDLPTVAFSQATQTVSESVGSVIVTASLASVAYEDASVPFTVTGTATAADHDLTAGTITIATGNQTGTVSFNVVDDTLDEDDETVVLTLGTPGGATVGTPNTHTITIQDDDAPPTIAFSSDSQSLAESVGTANLTVQLSTQSGKPISVPFTLDPASTASTADHSLVAGTISVPAGALSASAGFTITNDMIDEDDETIGVNLGAPTNATLGVTTTQTITISDDDLPPAVRFSQASQTLGENAGSVTLVVSLSLASAKPITVPFELSGSADSADHTLTAGQFSLAPGASSASLNFNLTDDGSYEPRETLVVSLTAPTNASLDTPATQTITILDNDGPTVSFSSPTDSVDEGAGSRTVTVQLSQPVAAGETISATYAVDPSSSAGSGDYSLPGQPILATSPALSNGPTGLPVVFTSGEISKSFNLTIVDDQLDEPNETLILALSVGEGSNASPGNPTGFTLTIVDDDETPIAASDSYTTPEDTVLTVPASQGLLANDTDGDGDSLTATLVSSTSQGLLSLRPDGSFVYTPTADFFGSDSFSYRASDAGGNQSAVATVALSVGAVNDNPQAVNDELRVDIDSVDNPLNVLANDTDIDGDALVVAAVTQPANGRVSIGANGTSLIYTPNPGFKNIDQFNYTISDGKGGSDSATVRVAVGTFRRFIALFATGEGLPPPGQPDLVGSLSVTPANPIVGAPALITVTVTNVGTARNLSPFWVDFYVNPRVKPTVNRPFNEVCPESKNEPCLGIAWEVKQGLLPGQSIVLTSLSTSYVVSNTIWSGAFLTPGTKQLYVYVDSWNRDEDGTPRIPQGAVVEIREDNNLVESKIVVHTAALADNGTTPEMPPAELPQPESLPLRQ